MLYLKNSAHQRELRKSINKLVSDIHESVLDRNDLLAENEESVASYVSRLNDELLNRSFLDYCSAAKNYVNNK
ncbi:hypothetical protein [Ekhidna sp.]